MSLFDDKQADVVDAFGTTSRYLDDILNINNVHFDNMVGRLYHSELQADVVDAFGTTSRYLDDILNINNVYFDSMVSQLYHSELPT